MVLRGRRSPIPRSSLALFVATASLVLSVAGVRIPIHTKPSTNENYNVVHPSNTVGTIVDTSYGSVQGREADSTLEFLGIPFAQPPTGELRWRMPVPPQGWNGVRDATVFGPACPQKYNVFYNISDTSEDCLTLNVFTSKQASVDSPLPVMLWVHGGSFTEGSGSQYEFDGTTLIKAANQSVVVVTINYRLGALGFLANGAFKHEEGVTPQFGNYGLADQQLAMRWVKENIAAFGGDSEKITLFGESAGAMSVCLHLGIESSRGLFHRAIIESGACTIQSMQPAQLTGNDVAKQLGCLSSTSTDAAKVRDCLRRVSVEALLDVKIPAGSLSGFPLWFPILDGTLVRELPDSQLRRGNVASVPVLVGANKNEGSLFICDRFPANLTKEAYDVSVNGLFSAVGDLVVERYNGAIYGTPRDALIALTGDVVFQCATRRIADLITLSKLSSFRYLFTRVPSWASECLQAFHTAEIAFVFNKPPRGVIFTPDEAALSAQMVTLWTSFARDGVPSAGEGGSIKWPESGSAHTTVILQNPVAKGGSLDVRDAPYDEQCLFWNTWWPVDYTGILF